MNLDYKIWQPPPYSAELARIIDSEWDEDFPPTCSGLWTDGSGGHRIHKNTSCKNPVVWWHPDDMYAYCQTHCNKFDKKLYWKSWFISRRIVILHSLGLDEG